MNVAYISKYQTLDIKNWSGTDYFIARSLEQQGINLDVIGAIDEQIPLWVRLKSKIYGRNKTYWIKRSPEFGKAYAKQVLQKIKPSVDVVFSSSTEPIAYLDTNKPKVFYTDATFASMLGYYDWFDNLSGQTIKESTLMEQRALNTCSLAFYASDWAAQSAIKDYNADPAKVKVIPLGANLTVSPSFNEVKKVIAQRDTKKCRILFLGVEWHRKGGDIVFEAVKYLNEELKLTTELDIVGIDSLPIDNLPDYVHNHGRISKATSEGLKRIEDLILRSHFLFVPSRAEAYGLVFCESMAFGVPCVSTKTGGISTIVKDGQNGILLAEGSSPVEYAENIYKLFSDRKRYEEIALYAFHDYESRLNWDVAGKTMKKYLQEL